MHGDYLPLECEWLKCSCLHLSNKAEPFEDTIERSAL
jgi:hypothetical protein